MLTRGHKLASIITIYKKDTPSDVVLRLHSTDYNMPHGYICTINHYAWDKNGTNLFYFSEVTTNDA